MSSTPRTLKRNLALREHILNGGTPKEFAYTWNVTVAAIGQALNNSRIKKYWLTESEWDLINKNRRLKQ